MDVYSPSPRKGQTCAILEQEQKTSLLHNHTTTSTANVNQMELDSQSNTILSCLTNIDAYPLSESEESSFYEDDEDCDMLDTFIEVEFIYRSHRKSTTHRHAAPIKHEFPTVNKSVCRTATRYVTLPAPYANRSLTKISMPSPSGHVYLPAGRPLGSGSGGAVTLYRRKNDGIPVAVKRFAPARVGESLQHRANKVDAEIQLLCMLDHPNIMNVLDVVELYEKTDSEHAPINSRDTLTFSRKKADEYTVKLLVTECYAGDLFSAVERNLSSMEMRELFCQLLKAVAYMHSRGVAHRDLKLENICIDRDDQIKIIDLGNAIRVAPNTAATQASLCFGVYGSDPYVPPEAWSSLQWWMTMVKGGNPLRAAAPDMNMNEGVAPEAAYANSGYNPFKADLWALGILLVAMTHKSFVWWRADSNDAGYAWFSKYRKNFVDGYTEPWQKLAIDSLLRINPDERMDAAELLQHMDLLKASESMTRRHHKKF
jgi:serine/threonine protein kinase